MHAAFADTAGYRQLGALRRATPFIENIRITELIRHCGEETAMHTVVGPVVVTRDGGFGFDLWTPEEGLSRGFSYRRIEDAYYARKLEIRSRIRSLARPMVACSTVDEFASALAEL
jgi:hypothetical protein